MGAVGYTFQCSEWSQGTGDHFVEQSEVGYESTDLYHGTHDGDHSSHRM